MPMGLRCCTELQHSRDQNRRVWCGRHEDIPDPHMTVLSYFYETQDIPNSLSTARFLAIVETRPPDRSGEPKVSANIWR